MMMRIQREQMRLVEKAINAAEAGIHFAGLPINKDGQIPYMRMV